MTTLREHIAKLGYTVQKGDLQEPKTWRQRKKAYAQFVDYFSALGYRYTLHKEGYTFYHFENNKGNGFSIFTFEERIAIDCYKPTGPDSSVNSVDWDLDK